MLSVVRSLLLALALAVLSVGDRADAQETSARSKFAGIYFGRITKDPTRAVSFGPADGEFALLVNDDNTGICLGYERWAAFLQDLPSGGFFDHTRTFFSRNVVVDANGNFTAVAFTYFPRSALTGGAGFVVPVPTPVTVPATAFSETSLRGNISELGVLSGRATDGPATANRSAVTGPTEQFAGFYAARAAESSRQLLAIADATGNVFAVLLAPDAVNEEMLGSTGRLAGPDRYLIDARRGSVDVAGNVTVTIPGMAARMTSAGEMFATVAHESGGTTTFAGLRSTAAAVSEQRITNVAARSAITRDAPAVVGFVIPGNAPRNVLLRAAGPALNGLGVTSPLAAPRLDLLRGRETLATNMGWSQAGNSGEIMSTTARLGAFPFALGSADCALLVELPPGAYAGVASGANGSQGTGLLEAYDVSDRSAPQRLANLSMRAPAGPGASPLLVGFGIEATVPKRLLIRAAGPALNAFGVRNFVARPRLTLRASSGAALATNEQWRNSVEWAVIADAARSSGAFPFQENSLDAALLINLSAGAYTAEVVSVDGTAGVTLVEIYELP